MQYHVQGNSGKQHCGRNRHLPSSWSWRFGCRRCCNNVKRRPNMVRYQLTCRHCDRECSQLQYLFQDFRWRCRPTGCTRYARPRYWKQGSNNDMGRLIRDKWNERTLIVTHSSLFVTSTSWTQWLLPEMSIPSEPPKLVPRIARLYSSPFDPPWTTTWNSGARNRRSITHGE